jgi:hypothetical protein
MVNEETQELVHFMAKGAGNTKRENNQGTHHQGDSI